MSATGKRSQNEDIWPSQAYRAAIDPHKRIKPSNCSEARNPCAIACRFQTDFQFMGNRSGSQLVICSSTDRFNQMEDAAAAEKKNRALQTARLAALFSLKRSAYIRMSRTERPVRMGMTRSNMRMNRCSTSTRSRSGSRQTIGRQNRNIPNSAHARNPGTTRSKNSKQSIKAEDNEKKSSRNPAKKIHEDFVEEVSLFDIADVSGVCKQN